MPKATKIKPTIHDVNNAWRTLKQKASEGDPVACGLVIQLSLPGKPPKANPWAHIDAKIAQLEEMMTA